MSLMPRYFDGNIFLADALLTVNPLDAHPPKLALH